jgi:DNA (cytosine-5)-methyltransferase 1
MHKANHPATRHYNESVWEVDPIEACAGRPVAFAWFSPDCTHFSKSKGGKPLSKKIRGLAWAATEWACLVRPRVIALENVEEFVTWGPLYKDHSHGCSKDHAKTHGKCRKLCLYQRPIPEKRGQTFDAFVAKLRSYGYVVEWRLLRACEYGAPTSRRRLFLIARCDGLPIVWPAKSHGPGTATPFRSAAECIDWTIPCPSIFDRERPLVEKTLARIARGIRKFVLEAERPFIVPSNDNDVAPIIIRAKTYGGGGNGATSAEAPLTTITTSKRGEHAVAAAYLVHRSNGERKGQAPRIYDVQQPLGTVVAQGNKHALCTAFLTKNHGGHESSKGGQSLEAPVDTIACRDQKSLTVAHLMKYYGTSTGSSLEDPAPTITSGGWKLAQVAAFLVRYNGTGDAEDLQLPLGTLTTRDRYGLVTVMIDGEEWVVVDIGMRMLTPRELFNAQGFTADYKIEIAGPKGKCLTQTAQIKMCGNSVPPPFSEAIARANLPEMTTPIARAA